MAERLFVARAATRGQKAMALSMGTLGLVNRSASTNAVRTVRRWDIDLSDHRSQGLGIGLLKRVEHIFVMERAHIDALAARDRSVARRARLLGELDGGPAEIADPVGQDLPVFEACADRLVTCIDAFLDEQGIGA